MTCYIIGRQRNSYSETMKRTEFIEYLKMLAEDLEESGSTATAEDFRTAVGFLETSYESLNDIIDAKGWPRCRRCGDHLRISCDDCGSDF